MKKGSKKTLKFASNTYTLDYLIANPPTNTQGLSLVWQTAVTSYFAEQGIDLTNPKNYSKPVEGIEFSHIMRIFQKLSKTKKVAAPKKKKSA